MVLQLQNVAQCCSCILKKKNRILFLKMVLHSFCYASIASQPSAVPGATNRKRFASHFKNMAFAVLEFV